MKVEIEAVVGDEAIDFKLIPESMAEQSLLLAIYRKRIDSSIEDDASVTLRFSDGEE